MTVRAGALVWDIDVAKAEEAQRRVDQLGRRLDQALNKHRYTGLDKVGRDADQASSRVQRLAARFNELQGQFRAGRITLGEYQRGLAQLQQGIERTRNHVGHSARDWAQLGTTMRQVQREQATLTGSTTQVTARVQALVNEVRVLRNEWQRTGQNTEETKARLNALQQEMRELEQQLRGMDGGWERFNQQIARLSVAGRSAEATIAGMEGRISRLGLASQVQLGVQQQLIGSLYRLGPAGAVAGSSLGVMAGGFGLMSAGALAATAGVAAVGSAAVALARDGIPEVKAMQAALNVLKASGEELELLGLQDILRDLQDAAAEAGNQFRRSEIATALAEVVKAGVDLAQAMDLMVPGMQLAVLTGQDLNETSTLLLGNLRQFGLQTTEAARVADALAAADLRAANGVRELSEGLAVVGPVAAAAGLSIEDTLGLLVELDNKGMDPATVGATGLRAALAALLDPTKEARDTLESLGVRLRDSEGRARPLKDVLFELAEAFAGNEEAAQAAATIFDTRALTAILNITDASREHADALRESEGALKDYAAQVTREDVAKAQERLSNAWRDLAGTFASGFGDDLVFVLDKFAAFLELFDRFLRDHQDVPWWARGTAWQQLNAITGGRVFGSSEDTTTPPATSGSSGGPLVISPELIARARELKAQLDAARDPAAWAAAHQAVEAFREESDEAALAWEAVNATMREASQKRPDRTWRDVFSDLTRDGTLAEQKAAAFGNTLDQRLESVQTRARLVERAIEELTTTFGDQFTFASAEVQFLIQRLETLRLEEERLKRELRTPPTLRDSIAGAVEGRQRTVGEDGRFTVRSVIQDAIAAPGGVTIDPEAERARLQRLAAADARVKGELARSEREYVQQALRNLNLLGETTTGYVTLADRAAGANVEVVRAFVEMGEVSERALIPALREQESALERLMGVYQVGSEEWLAYAATLARVRAELERLTDGEAALEAAQRSRAEALARRTATTGELTTLQVNAQRVISDAVRGFLLTGDRSGMAALRELEEQLVTMLNELGDSPEAAPLAGLLTRVRAALAQMESDARATSQRIERLLLNTGAAQARSDRFMEQREFGRRLVEAVGEGSLEALEELEADILARLAELGDDPSAAPLIGLLTRTRAEIANLEAGLASFAEGQSVVAERGRWVFNDFTRGAETADERMRTLQTRIQSLIRRGFDPASDEVQRLVTQMNALALRLALEELREKGVANLSAFAREVLKLNGLLSEGPGEARRFSDALRSLGDDQVTTGLADVLDGIERIRTASGDAEEAVAGLTQALKGVQGIINGLTSGDAFEVVRSLAMLLGEGIGQAAGVPGVGQLVGAVFDLGRVIVQAISDAFTGDSPAARAIREGLTPAIQQAFANGMLAALQGEKDWREALRENLQLAFLTSLINAFVQSQVVQALFEPLFLEYSKMVARGQYDAAADFLASALPEAIRVGIERAEQFLDALPPGLLPTPSRPPPPPTPRGPEQPTPTGVFQLPTAAITGIAAPQWTRDLISAGRLQLDAAQVFRETVEVLRSEGFTVRVEASGERPTGGAALAARSI